MKTATFEGEKGSRGNILDHLRTLGLLARWPLIGAVLFILGLALFGGFAYSLETNGPLVREDLPVGNGLHTTALHSPAYLIQAMIFGSFLGREMVVIIAVLLIFYFLYKKYWRELTMVIIGFGGEEVLFETLSRLFHRHRPVFPQKIWEVLPGPGFPSGHVMSAMVCYGFLAYLLVPYMPNRFWKGVVIALAVLISLYIGFSRVFVGDHYLSDVLAGYALGIAWAAFAYTTIELAFRKKVKRELR